MDQIIKSVEQDKLAKSAGYLDCFKAKDRMLLRTMNGVLIQMGQQWTGVNVSSFSTWLENSLLTSPIRAVLLLLRKQVLCHLWHQ